MDNIEDLKIMWQDLNQRLSHLESENRMLMQNIMKTNYKTTQEKLVNKYGVFIAVEFIMICFMTLFFIFNPEVNEKYRISALIYWDAFFMIEVLFDFYLLYRIKTMDVFNSTIKDVASRAASNWRLHKMGIVIGLPLAFGAILLFALALNANEFTIMGMIVGGLIGFIIGIQQLLKFRSYYNLLQTND
ncbi:MAG: hypothetical protein J1F67_06330 [Muribaculaceae bacterium]|nr:hypothetical protein [Muribaculaceae bacterium]